MDILTDQAFFRAFHILFGITWIGLLYYFNFIQGEYVKIADPDAYAYLSSSLESIAVSVLVYSIINILALPLINNSVTISKVQQI